MQLPKKRQAHLVVEELPDEVLVYDLQRHKAHCLNRSAALIWTHCDGQTTVAQLTRLLHKECGLPDETEMVTVALERLASLHLLEGPSGARSNGSSSRRDLIRKFGLAGAAALL